MAAPRPLTPLPLPLPQLYDHFQNEARRSDDKQAAPRQRARRAQAVVFAPKLLLASGVVPIPDQLLALPRSAGQASRDNEAPHREEDSNLMGHVKVLTTLPNETKFLFKFAIMHTRAKTLLN